MISIYKTLLLCFFLCLATFGLSQMVEKSTAGPFLLKNGTIHTITNGIVKGDLLIEGMKIKSIGTNLESDEAKILDCTDLHIYPGMIDGGTTLGLSEISSISLTKDYNEPGDFTPHMEALTAVNPNSVNIPVTRTNGVTTVLSVPSGGLFPGRAALIHLHGYTPQQMFAGFKSHVLKFPSSGKKHRWDRRKPEEIKKDYKDQQKKLNDFWKSAVQFSKIDSAANKQGKILNSYNPQLASLSDVVKGEAPLIIDVNKKDDILVAIDFVTRNKIQAIFSGVSEGYLIADSLVKYDIPVIVGPILSLPSRTSDRFDVAYKNAGELLKAGVKLCIKTNENENVRNLPFNAGFAANYGMGTDEAMKAITINAAEIFGLEKEIGSLENGKKANLYICDGDPFEMKTSITHLFINGFNVPIENRHTLLHDEFLERSPGLQK